MGSIRVSVRGGRGRPQSFLHASGSWRHTSPGIANDMLQSALVLGSGSGSSVPDGDGGGEEGLNDGGVKVHQH